MLNSVGDVAIAISHDRLSLSLCRELHDFIRKLKHILILSTSSPCIMLMLLIQQTTDCYLYYEGECEFQVRILFIF